jgi:hypothetical protein
MITVGYSLLGPILAAKADIPFQSNATAAAVMAEIVKNDRLEIDLLGIFGLPSFGNKRIKYCDVSLIKKKVQCDEKAMKCKKRRTKCL